MKTQDQDDVRLSTRVGAFLVIWLFSIVLSMIAGHCGAYVGGMRPGGWNIHMIYPPIIGGGIGLIVYPILRISLQVGSEDKDKGLFSAMFASIILAALTCFLLVLVSE